MFLGQVMDYHTPSHWTLEIISLDTILSFVIPGLPEFNHFFQMSSLRTEKKMYTQHQGTTFKISSHSSDNQVGIQQTESIWL